MRAEVAQCPVVEYRSERSEGGAGSRPEMSGAGLLELLDERPGDAETVAVFSGDREVTRTALRAAAKALADRLREAGLRPAQPVAVMLPNGPEVVAALFGVWYAGGVYVPINPRVTPAELAHFLDATRPAVLRSTDRSTLPRRRAAPREIPLDGPRPAFRPVHRS